MQHESNFRRPEPSDSTILTDSMTSSQETDKRLQKTPVPGLRAAPASETNMQSAGLVAAFLVWAADLAPAAGQLHAASMAAAVMGEAYTGLSHPGSGWVLCGRQLLRQLAGCLACAVSS